MNGHGVGCCAQCPVFKDGDEDRDPMGAWVSRASFLHFSPRRRSSNAPINRFNLQAYERGAVRGDPAMRYSTSRTITILVRRAIESFKR